MFTGRHLFFLALGVLALGHLAACSHDPAPAGSSAGGSSGSSSGSGATGSTASAAEAGGSCPALAASAVGVEHAGQINASETWTAADSPHRVTSDLTIYGSVTVDKCATVIVSPGAIIDVGTDTVAGTLHARGNYAAASGSQAEVIEPVIFTSTQASTYWGGIVVGSAGTAQFDMTVLVRGGDINAVNNAAATLSARGPNDGTLSTPITPNLLLIVQSGGFGVAMQTGAGFAAPTTAVGGLIVLGSGTQAIPATWNQDYLPQYPLVMSPPGLATIPTSVLRGTVASDLTYSDTLTALDQILVLPNRTVKVDEAFHARGVPYLLQESFDMQPPGTATLTIDPGVEIRVHSNSAHSVRISLGDSVTPSLVQLNAAGTATAPITFTSDAAAPAAGDWVGLVLNGQPMSGNMLSNASIRYAGGDSTTSSYGCGPGDNDSAILILGWRPDNAFLQNVTIADSLGSGIVCGWRSNVDGPDLKTGNTFTNIGNLCDIAKWQLDTGTNYCPGRTEIAPLCL